MQGHSDHDTGVAVVALVTSAGGLGALTTVLSNVPADVTAAVVVQQHLGGQGSRLVHILRARTGHDIEWATDGALLEPGRILVAPARRRLEVLPDGSCAIAPGLMDVRDGPHDALLTSLADSYGSRALAVVLTGLGRDGAAGVRAMKDAGGLVIAQDEDTAEQPSMPRAAAEAGADLVLPLHQVGPVVAEVVRGAPLPRATEERDAIRETFGDDGPVAALARETDWTQHPLGPVRAWPAGLRQAIRFVVDSPGPASVHWGTELYSFFNDATIPHLGDRHVELFGGRHEQVFPEVWARGELPRLLAQVMAGTPVSVASAHLPFVRVARLEDAWFDLYYTPIRGSGGTAGLTVFLFERTHEVLDARRLETLNRLANVRAATGQREALQAVLEALDRSADILFAAAYLIDAAGSRAGLVDAIGVAVDTPMAPRQQRLSPGGGWPLHQAVKKRRATLVDELSARFPGHLVGSEQTAPESAVLHPLWDEAQEKVVGVLVLGTSPRLPFDDRYQEFLSLVGETVSNKVAESGARQREKERLARLAELDRTKTEFYSNVSHEFRTPLTLMLSPLDEMLDGAEGLTDRLKEELERVRRNAHRLLRLVGTILDFSQIEAGRMRAHFEPVDLAACTRDILAQFDSAITRAGLGLSVTLQPLPEPVWVDTDMWEKIVSNLVSNALKFTFEGVIEVRLRSLPKHAELVVRDTGAGIAPEELPFIFKRFHRVREMRARTYEGAGIGLALVNELVRRHHGRVRVTSEVGEGTTFTVWMPLGERPGPVVDAQPPGVGGVAAAMAEEAERWNADEAAEIMPEAEELPTRVAGAVILAVDDNPDMRDYLARLLGTNWTVTLARDGAHALELARTDPPDLVLSDVMMPRLDGFELLREMRADERFASTPFILLTARAGEEAAIEGLLAGADDYIVKPFSARELVARISGQLELAGARRRAAELNGFRIGLSDALRALTDPLVMQQTACRMLLGQLGADRARFVEVDVAAGEFITMGGYAVDGMPGGFGRYGLEDYAPLARGIQAGRRLKIDDTRSDPYVRDIADALADLQIGAQLVIPLVRDGGSIVALAVHNRAPRHWTDEDLAIAEEVAGRTWAEVERARAEAALRESEERFRALATTSPLGVGVSSAKGEIIYTNEAYTSMLGYGEDALLGKPATVEYYDAADRAWIPSVEETGSVRDHEVRLRREDGSPVWVSINVAPIEFDGQQAIIGVVQDVTERRQAEVALRRSEERHAYLLTLSDALRPLTSASEIKAAAARLLGRQLRVDSAFCAEVLGDDWLISDAYEHDAGHQEQGRHPMAQCEQWIVGALRTGQRLVVRDLPLDARFEADHHDAHVRGVVAVPVLRDAAMVAAFVVHSATAREWQDHEIALVEATAERAWAVLDRARIQAALRTSEERMRMAVRATGIVTWEWVPSEDRITTSDSFADVYGLPALATADDGFALVLPEDREQHLDKVRAIATQGGSYNSEFRIRRPDDGRTVWLEERAEATLGAAGVVESVIGVTLDITRRKRREQMVHERKARPSPGTDEGNADTPTDHDSR